MKKPLAWNPAFGLIGLSALLIYVLACTSFSLDDSKVLYPTVDAKGLTAIAVYDRKSGKSELLFQPLTHEVANLTAKPAIMRPQWLEGGHSFLTAWQLSGNDSDKSLNLAVLPFDKRGPARTFFLPDLGKDNATHFYFWPLPVIGSTLFLNSDSNTVLRLNLTTGEMDRKTNTQELVLLPSPDNDRLIYLTDADTTKEPAECGLLNPDTFVRTPLFKIPAKMSMLSIALSRDAKHFAYQVENENPPVVHLLESGQPAKTLALAGLGEKAEVSVRQFSPKGDILYGAIRIPADDKNASYGFVEIPLNGSPMRTTILFSNAPAGDKELLGAFQPDISHDGKTLAVESLWFAFGDHPIKAEDCALFLVDLSSPQRKITKVSIPVPPKDGPSPFGK